MQVNSSQDGKTNTSSQKHAARSRRAGLEGYSEKKEPNAIKTAELEPRENRERKSSSCPAGITSDLHPGGGRKTSRDITPFPWLREGDVSRNIRNTPDIRDLAEAQRPAFRP